MLLSGLLPEGRQVAHASPHTLSDLRNPSQTMQALHTRTPLESVDRLASDHMTDWHSSPEKPVMYSPEQKGVGFQPCSLMDCPTMRFLNSVYLNCSLKIGGCILFSK